MVSGGDQRREDLRSVTMAAGIKGLVVHVNTVTNQGDVG